MGKEGIHPVAQGQDKDQIKIELATEAQAPETRPVIEMSREALEDDSGTDSEVAKIMDNEKEPEKFKDAAAAKKK